MQKKGLLIVISGFSGVGKGTIVKELLKRWPDDFALSISATSRSMREGEEEGREYFFVSREAFEEMIPQVYEGNVPHHCNLFHPKESNDSRQDEGSHVLTTPSSSASPCLQ